MRFGDYRAELMQAVDEVFGERVRLSFLDRGTVDPTRAAVEIVAKLRVREGEGTNDRREHGRMQVHVAAGRSRLSIDRSRYDGPAIRTGDKVKALDRPDTPWFFVSRVDDRDPARLHLELTEA